MPRPRMTTRRLMSLVVLVACGLSSFRYLTDKNHFAIIGEIDINRDGIDDRDKLRCMIEDAGGVVDFDFPPPEIGKPTGRLSTRTNWYLCDDRTHCPDPNFDWRAAGPEWIRRERLNKRIGQYIKEARLDGARPMDLRTLLEWSGKLEWLDP
jgi:hypothetical protein